MGNAQQSLQLSLALSLDARVIVLGVDNGGRHLLLDLVDEVETSCRQQLLPAGNHAHFPLDGLTGAVLGLDCSITLGDTLDRGGDLGGYRFRVRFVTTPPHHLTKSGMSAVQSETCTVRTWESEQPYKLYTVSVVSTKYAECDIRTHARTHAHTHTRTHETHTRMKTLRPINIKQGKTTNQNNSFFSEKKKELLRWDSNPRHTTC